MERQKDDTIIEIKENEAFTGGWVGEIQKGYDKYKAESGTGAVTMLLYSLFNRCFLRYREKASHFVLFRSCFENLNRISDSLDLMLFESFSYDLSFTFLTCFDSWFSLKQAIYCAQRCWISL